MFEKLLIANRGEIACRVAATARRLGVRTVAVYSDADSGARHVAACDEAVRLGPAPAKESYLDQDAVLAAARATGAQAIHPGYGFLSENEDFAARCAQEGLVFVGPPASAIAAMGLKSAAKALMAKAGVPVVPGYHGAAQDPALLATEAARVGFPVLIKASAGGGGKGMRVVERAQDFAEALRSCQREATGAFGDDAVLLERYLTRPRHIEVQVFADAHGRCVALSERDCSVQRRHQKVLEEAPAPGLSPERRLRMGEAAVAAARAVGYVGAGTVEFIAEGDDFYFMEMNTRLQVEHPVTEMVCGVDLVEWQLRVAAGEPLALPPEGATVRGHALEARVYAENPEKGFLPSTGTLSHLHLPEGAAAFTVGALPGAPTPAAVRVDSGVREGDEISPHYDPMILKLIVWGQDREQALHRMREALGEVRIVGVSTNVEFLKRVLASAPFAQAQLDTGLIARNHATLFPPVAPPPREVLALACASLLAGEEAAAKGERDPWAQPSGWRLNEEAVRSLRFTCAAGPVQAWIRYGRQGYVLQTVEGAWPLALAAVGPALTVLLGGERVHGTVVPEGARLHVFAGGLHHLLERFDPFASGSADAALGALTAPMPGKLVALLATPGAPLARGAPLLVMEAMKMEHTVTAPAAGRVRAFLFQPGQQVAEGATLVDFEPGEG